MKKKNVIYNLVIANLTVLFLLLLRRFTILKEFINVLVLVIITPILFGVFLFYILKPLNNVFIKKGLKKSRASLLTLVILAFAVCGIVRYFGTYLLAQILQLKEMVWAIVFSDEFADMIGSYTEDETVTGVIGNVANQVMSYLNVLMLNAKNIFDLGMMIFSDFLLVILITFFLLKDGEKFKPTVLKFVPSKYKDIVDNILSKSDDILSTYVVGQATVALSLAVMVFIGYKIIRMPSAILLASITFILAFIPFIGFFISMIIPYIIAIIVGPQMILKLSILVLIAQTLKGRVVVPFIMGKAMKIHPITDIFLVVGAAAIGGPLLAFCIVPIYSILKFTFQKLKENNMLSFLSKVDNSNKV